MVSDGLQLDKHVVYIDLHCSTNLLFEHHIDKKLVGCSCVLETKWHDLVIVEPMVCNEEGVFLIRDMHWDLVIS